MAIFYADGVDDLVKDLGKLEFEKIAPKALKKAEPIMTDKLKASTASHRQTGDMVGSIKAREVKKKGDMIYIFIGPSGKGSNGTRNMEKMAYLEYGRTRQAATPVVVPAITSAESSVLQAFQQAFDEAVKEVQA